MKIFWEGREYIVTSDNFVGFCEELGVEGREDLLSVLIINYPKEVAGEMKELGGI